MGGWPANSPIESKEAKSRIADWANNYEIKPSRRTIQTELYFLVIVITLLLGILWVFWVMLCYVILVITLVIMSS